MTKLTITRHGRVAVLTLTDPDNGNRLNREIADAVTAALQTARGDAAIGACVMTGCGDVFCLGGDYEGAGSTAEGRAEYARALIDMDRAMARLGKPLVAAVNGDAHAGGLGVVVGCDLAVASAGATFGLPEAASGLFPFIALAIVRDALPKKALFDLIYNARLLTAQEALELKLVNEVVRRGDAVARAIELADHASRYNAGIVTLGRDLYYGMRGMEPVDALEAARVALLAALAAKDRAP